MNEQAKKNDEAFKLGINDKPTEKDALGMGDRCSGIANFVTKCSMPMTIAIQGGWGTGKTSAMMQIRKSILDKVKAQTNNQQITENEISLWFNTWQFAFMGNGDTLIFDLMLSLFRQLQKTLDGFNKNKKRSKELSDIISGILKILSAIALGVTKGALPIIGEPLEKVCELINKMQGEETAKFNPMSFQFMTSASMQALQMHEIISVIISSILRFVGIDRFYIFIDDLDRLEPRVAVELLEGLKNMADFDNCVFLLAIDQEIVFRGLSSKLGEAYGNTDAHDREEFKEKSQMFFDKIIQIPFSLPVNAYDINSFISSLIYDNQQANMYAEILEEIGETNPRTIKRSLNLLQLYGCIKETSLKVSEKDYDEPNNEELKRYAVMLLFLKKPKCFAGLRSISAKYKDCCDDFVIELNEFLQEDDISGDIWFIRAVLRRFYADNSMRLLDLITGPSDELNSFIETQDVNKTLLNGTREFAQILIDIGAIVNVTVDVKKENLMRCAKKLKRFLKQLVDNGFDDNVLREYRDKDINEYVKQKGKDRFFSITKKIVISWDPVMSDSEHCKFNVTVYYDENPMDLLNEDYFCPNYKKDTSQKDNSKIKYSNFPSDKRIVFSPNEDTKTTEPLIPILRFCKLLPEEAAISEHST